MLEPRGVKIMLDLHGLKVSEVKKLIEEQFAKIEQHNIGEIYIITGAGNHINSNGSRGVLKKILPGLLRPYCQNIIQINKEFGAYKIILKPRQKLFDLKDLLTTFILDENKHIECANILKQKADDNDVEAILALATIYLHKAVFGFDNVDEGIALLLKAKQLGSVEAEVQLGIIYHDGLITKQRHEKAFKHFRRAANCGHAVAEYYMGVCYLHGKGVKYNNEQAVKWMKSSADKNDIHAQDSLGDFYLMGEITPKNMELGIFYKTKSAEQGLADAQIDLARCYATGYGVKQNSKAAFKWYLAAAQSNQAYAVYQVGSYLLDGRSGFPPNPVEAFRWFLKAAELDDGDGQAQVASQYLFGEGGIKQNIEEGLAWATKAVNKKNKYGYYVMANAYLNGIGVEKNSLEGYRFMKLSAEASHPQAQYELGLLLLGETSSDIPQDFDHGKKWLEKAAEHNHPEAIQALRMIRPKPAKSKSSHSHQSFFESASKTSFIQSIRNSFHLRPDEIIILDIDYKFPLIDCMILEGNANDKKKALFVLEQMAEQNCIFSLRRIARFYSFGFKKLNIKKDIEIAVQYLQKAVKLGDSKSMVSLGHFYEQGVDIQKSLQTALVYYQNAVELHNPIACCQMSRLYMEGVLGEPNYEKSCEYFEQAIHYEKQKGMVQYLNTGPLDEYSILGDSAGLLLSEQKKHLMENTENNSSNELNHILHFFKDTDEADLPSPEVALRRAAAGLRPKNDFGLGNQKNILQYLISKVSDINTCSPTTGMTALHYAVIKNQVENVSLLLSVGANVDIKDKKEKTAKDYALESSNNEIIELLQSLDVNNNANAIGTEIINNLDKEIRDDVMIPDDYSYIGMNQLVFFPLPTVGDFFAASKEYISESIRPCNIQ